MEKFRKELLELLVKHELRMNRLDLVPFSDGYSFRINLLMEKKKPLPKQLAFIWFDSGWICVGSDDRFYAKDCPSIGAALQQACRTLGVPESWLTLNHDYGVFYFYSLEKPN